jgi:hypothetical protein
VTNATVSKVCKQLEADLVIERGRGETPSARRLRLLQPEKLLDLLAANYAAPRLSRTWRGQWQATVKELDQRLSAWRGKQGRKVVRTGACSVASYAILAREAVETYYCSDLKSVVQALGDRARPSDRFSNLVIQETGDDFVYFDGRPGLVSSPIQSYLELLAGDPRERETAAQVRRTILELLSRASSIGG